MNGHRFEFRSVSKSFGRHVALSEVSYALAAGEHTAILGPSGCGKSTALRLLAGLDAPTVGEVWMNGEAASTAGRVLLPPHRRGLAMVFQDLALWPNLTVLGNVLLGISGQGLTRPEARRRAEEALRLCHIEDLSSRRPGQTSGGQQQRVALARALAARPAFLLLDEPFAGLDIVTKTQLLRDIGGLARDRPFTVVLVTHDPLEAATLCRNAIVLEEGRLVDAGCLADLLIQLRSEMFRAFQGYYQGVTNTVRS